MMSAMMTPRMVSSTTVTTPNRVVFQKAVQNLSPEPVKMLAKFFLPTNGSVSLTNPVSGSSPGWP